MNIQLLFDLDGTLSDPVVGIGNAINHALAYYGRPPQPPSAIGHRPFYRPPLGDSFPALAGTDDKEVIQGYIDKFGEYYRATGYAENTVYPAIPDVLQAFTDRNIIMGICTTKRAESAERILTMFGLRNYFKVISGGGHHVQKWQQIEQLLAEEKIDTSTIMIGDRSMDIVAASKNGLRSAAVLWGYGSQEEIEAHQPDFVLNTPEELLALV